MSTNYINRRRNLIEPKPKKDRGPFYFGDMFPAEAALYLLMIIVTFGMIGGMIFYGVSTVQNKENILSSMQSECGFTPSSSGRDSLLFTNKSVGFVTMQESGKKVPVELFRTEKQLTFTNFESHETLCSVKL